ncbi:SlyX family protein [Roseibium marinum]|uniref:SlyX protein n=1 Tax=Roseibium marinum TaxID=281252 RepID=A0A2S3V3U7_9HYPH|nr:SlyX family protein [Roseibium marinum]POF34664.1 SlyX protein [Roseibium marinum]
MANDHEQRLEQLEISLAHATHTIDELNQVVVGQGKQIDRLTRLVGNMTEQVDELMENVLPGHQGEKPPHY